ncbi:DUF3947 family protein [Bacillus sp. NPDC094077]|uniref:DUF3947 family protein n=1 Tax=Bacillus sp. NPDC094077 TaxID=3390932 RepID=UPI003D0211FA
MMSCHFYNRDVDSAITLAGAQGTIHAVYHTVQAQQQLQQSMQVQHMPYYGAIKQIVHYDVYPAGLFSIPYGGVYFL